MNYRGRFLGPGRAGLAAVLLAAALCTPASAETAGSPLAILAPRSSADLAALASGAREWLHAEITAAGIPIQARGTTLAAARAVRRLGIEPPDPAALTEIVARTGAGRLLAGEMNGAEGFLELRLRCHDAAGAVLAEADAKGRVGETGALLREVLGRLLPALGVSAEQGAAESPAPPPAPRIADLAAYGRTETLLSEGRLLEAWREIEGIATPAADLLRRDIETLAAAPDAPAAERSRLASAQGRADSELLRVRATLREGTDAPMLVAGGEAALARNEAARALEFYDQAAALDATSYDARIGRARALRLAGRGADATEAYLAAIDLHPEDPDAYAELVEDANVPSVDRAKLLLHLAELRTQRLDPERAAADFQRAADLDPALADEAQRGSAELAERLGDHQQAVTSWEHAATLSPGNPEVLTGLGRSRRRSGDAAGAESALREAVGLDDRNAEAQRLLGTVLAEQGRGQEAVVHLQAAIAIDPTDPRATRALDVAEGRAAAESLVPAGASSAVLAGSTAVAVPDAAKEREAEAAADPDPSVFDELARSFPQANPQSGEPLGRVLFLGVREELDWRGKIMDWLQPRTLDLDAVAVELLRAGLKRWDIPEPEPMPEALSGPLADLQAFGTGRDTVAVVTDGLGVDAIFLARVSHPRPEGEGTEAGLVVEARLAGGRTSASVFLLGNASLVQDGSRRFARWNVKAAGVYALLLVLAALPFVRGRGSLVVTLDYETSEEQGFRNIQVTRRSGKTKHKESADAGEDLRKRFQLKKKTDSRFFRQMVGRETRFKGLPARTWFVGVHRLLVDPTSQAVIGNFFEEKTIQIERGKAAVAHFDFRQQHAPVQVQLRFGDGAAKDSSAVVALRGRPDTARYAHMDEVVVLHVDRGEHTVVVGFADRVHEQSFTISHLTGFTLAFDLTRSDDALFRGCPEAVTPYVQGDLLAAAEALARNGNDELANLLRARFHEGRGERREAARFYRAAGLLEQAAALVADEDERHGATLFEQAGDHRKAAALYRGAGEFARAAQAYEEVNDLDAALECWLEAGERSRALGLLERTGDFLEAARIALELGDRQRAIANLQRIESRDLGYGEACSILGELFAERGEPELAIQKLEEAVRIGGQDGAPLELQERLGALLEESGRVEEALTVFETIRKRDFDYPGAEARVESLRRRITDQRTRATAVASAGAAATAPLPGVASAGDAGRYEILGEIGRGAMGVVYKARDTRLGRVVALKRLPENLKEHPTAVRLFLREARAAAALNHPNVVTLFDAGEEAGAYYLTMEFLDGVPLDKILKSKGALPPRAAAGLALQVAQGLEYAHGERIVHRDIKPSNLFFTRSRVAKIMDFGLAKMIEEVRRAATVIGGTPYYMAPEQAAGDAVDHRADLYAFGVTLFELVTGRVPFPSGDVTYHHRHTAAPDPRTLRQGLPDALAELILALMAKTPDERPATTGEVVRRLDGLARSLSA